MIRKVTAVVSIAVLLLLLPVGALAENIRIGGEDYNVNCGGGSNCTATATIGGQNIRLQLPNPFADLLSQSAAGAGSGGLDWSDVFQLDGFGSMASSNLDGLFEIPDFSSTLTSRPDVWGEIGIENLLGEADFQDFLRNNSTNVDVQSQVQDLVNQAGGFDNLSQSSQDVLSGIPGFGGTGGSGGGGGGTSGTPGSAYTSKATDLPVGAALTEPTKREVFSEETGHNLTQAWDGWQPEYGGMRNSPILIDPVDKDNKRTRSYPELNAFDGGLADTMNEDLSVDDEIDKVSMAVFQPTESIINSFVENKQARDEHLNLFSSLRGVAILTLSYLDKTVAAGLATVQQQADQDATHALLKQVAWNTAKLANPEREMMYNDVDEKFESCMAENSKVGSDQKTKPEYVVYDDCDDRCQSDCSARGGALGGLDCMSTCRDMKSDSPYHYCVICAQRSIEVNVGTANADGDFASHEKAWSLVERVFAGVEKPGESVTVPNSDESIKAGKQITDFAKSFRSIYGDYVWYQDENKRVRTRFVTPFMSVPNWVRALRDKKGPEGGVVDQGCVQYDQESINIKYCPITGDNIEEGICPSFQKIFDWVKNNEVEAKENTEEWDRAWVEASLGGFFDVRDMKDVVSIGNDQSETEADTRQKRFIKSFCDSSAVNAFKKMHLRTMSIALDHLALNSRATRDQKAKILALMGRVSQYLDLGVMDSQASPAEMIAAVNREAGLLQAAQSGAIVGAMRAAMDNMQNRTPQNFGGGVPADATGAD